MIAGKTAALLGLACELGGLLAGAQDERVQALRDFGEAIGKAFQMRDDLLGLWGDQTVTGKPVGSDLLKRKKTLPILHGMASSSELKELLLKPQFGQDNVTRALELLEASGSPRHTEAKAQAFHEQAMAALARSEGTGEAHQALHDLADRLLNRRH
jgi:geranylgeranyl diphosphate synthase type I